MSFIYLKQSKWMLRQRVPMGNSANHQDNEKIP